MRKLAAAAAVAVALAACGQDTSVTIQAAMNVNLTSPDFPATPDPVPRSITCDGGDHAPALKWSDPPPTTRSLVVELIDTQAAGGVFTHWLVYDIPAGAQSLAPPLPANAIQGRNGYGGLGYRGPCPPAGQTHIYLLLIYATTLDPTLPGGLTRAELENRFRDHVIGMGQLEGTYSR